MGEAVAMKFSSEGSNIIISGRYHSRGEALVNRIGDPYSYFVHGDVGDPKINRDLVDSALNRFGRVDCLVICAGKLGIGKITEITVEEWQETVKLNLNAVFYLLKYAIPAMHKNVFGTLSISNLIPLQFDIAQMITRSGRCPGLTALYSTCHAGYTPGKDGFL